MSVSVTRDRRLRIPLKATYKIIITNPDGSIAQVIEGKSDDPFTFSFVRLFYTSLIGPVDTSSQGIYIYDVAGTELYLYTPAPPAGIPYPTAAVPYPGAALCLVNCPGTPNAPYVLKLPGIWLYSSPFYNPPSASGIYSYLITNIIYYTPSISPNMPLTIGATNTITITQSFTNTSGSTISIYSLAVVAAFYPVTSSGLAGTPYFVDIAYFNLSPAAVWSPAAGMTIQVTFQVPT